MSNFKAKIFFVFNLMIYCFNVWIIVGLKNTSIKSMSSYLLKSSYLLFNGYKRHRFEFHKVSVFGNLACNWIKMRRLLILVSQIHFVSTKLTYFRTIICLFLFIIGLFKQLLLFLSQKHVKIYHQLCSAVIRTYILESSPSTTRPELPPKLINLSTH